MSLERPVYRRLLVYLHDEDSAGVVAERACLTAKAFGATVDLIDTRIGDEPKQPRRFLAEALAWLRSEGLTAELRLIEGEAAAVLLTEASAGGYDLVLTPAGRSILNPTLATLSKRLLHACPKPLEIVRPAVPWRQGILVNIDPAPDDPATELLNHKILLHALSLAEREQRRLEVVHVCRAFGQAILQGLAATPDEDYERFVEDLVRSRREALAATLERFPEIQGGRVHVVRDEGLCAVCDAAEQAAAGMVVLAAPEPRLLSAITASHAERLVEELDCSVLAIRGD